MHSVERINPFPTISHQRHDKLEFEAHKNPGVPNSGVLLFHQLVDGLAQIVNGAVIAGGYRIDHAVAHMVF